MSLRDGHTTFTVDRIHRNSSWEPACRLLVSGGSERLSKRVAEPCLFGGLLKIGVSMKSQHLSGRNPSFPVDAAIPRPQTLAPLGRIRTCSLFLRRGIRYPICATGGALVSIVAPSGVPCCEIDTARSILSAGGLISVESLRAPGFRGQGDVVPRGGFEFTRGIPHWILKSGASTRSATIGREPTHCRASQPAGDMQALFQRLSECADCSGLSGIHVHRDSRVYLRVLLD